MTEQTFISYSKKDSEFSYRLADDLKAAGFKIWIDRSIGGGDDWRRTIESNLEAAGEVIIVVSPQSIASKWVNHEGSMAYSLKKKLFPVLFKAVDSMPPWFEEFQWIDFVKKPYETAFAELVQALTPPNPIQDLLNQEVINFKQNGVLIDEDTLRVIQKSRNTLKISQEAEDLLARSSEEVESRRRKEIQVQMELERARHERERVIRIMAIVTVALTLVLSIVSSMFSKPLTTSAAPNGILSLELAGSTAAFRAIFDSWDEQKIFLVGVNLGFDFLFIIIYSTAIALGCFWGSRKYRQVGFHDMAKLGRVLAYGMWLAALLDMLENFLLIYTILTQSPLLPAIIMAVSSLKLFFILLGFLYVITAWIWKPRSKSSGLTAYVKE